MTRPELADRGQYRGQAKVVDNIVPTGKLAELCRQRLHPAGIALERTKEPDL